MVEHLCILCTVLCTAEGGARVPQHAISTARRKFHSAPNCTASVLSGISVGIVMYVILLALF